ncbi:HAD family hydrolase [Pyruvatibacter mobilis]|uniref:HAD family hydrolase n=1 Tax=Pyruvatibacter mobilis TaxID=1712261 RepID=UPI003D133607
MMSANPIQLLVCDLDNTLYDWVGFFVPSFYEMVKVAVDILDCEEATLLNELKRVHQIHHDAEHPFALLETQIVQNRFPSVETARKELDPAFHAFNKLRKSKLVLYPSVKQGLEALGRAGVKIVAHTESQLFAALGRLEKLDIAGQFSHLYCKERPKTLSSNAQPLFASVSLAEDRVIELSHHQRKPNPDVLTEICEREGVPCNRAAYLGDSLAKDILMAKQAGVLAIWAAYGTKHETGLYEKLVRVSHWSDSDVRREKYLSEKSRSVVPDFVVDSFAEVVALCIGTPRAIAESS